MVKNTNGRTVLLSDKDFINPDSKSRIKEIEERSFKKFTQSEFDEKIMNRENIWATYKFGEDDWKLLSNDRQRYEGFVCGFLEYYDSEVRNGMSDHGVFFHWGQWDKDPFCCVIFLDPAPTTKALKYSDSTDRFGNKYFGQIAEVDSPTSKASDPPRVPPPPPPY
jgi:hypothetical protein